MYEVTYGAKYEDGLDVKEIAKRVRKEIQAAVKAGELPKGLKASVRISRYSGGQSLYVKVTAVPRDFVVYNPERVRLDHEEPHRFHDVPYLTPEARAVEKKIEALYGAYNYDGSEPQTDYFNVNFYGHVSWDYDLEKADKARTLARLKGEPVLVPAPTPKKEKPKPSVTDEEVEELLKGLAEKPDTTFAVFELSRSRLKRAGWTGKLRSLVGKGVLEVVEGRTAYNGAKLYRLARTPEQKAACEAREARAEELGKAAFKRGAKCAPVNDPEVMALVKESAGDGYVLLQAWHRGYTRANLAEPVSGVSTLEHPDNDPDLNRRKAEAAKKAADALAERTRAKVEAEKARKAREAAAQRALERASAAGPVFVSPRFGEC